MSAQLLEILFFAGIAFVIISKFISILGTSDEDDQARANRSYFGEPGSMKDVTNSDYSTEANVSDILKIAKKVKKLDEEDAEHLKSAFEAIPNFDTDKFLKGAKGAFGMILTALKADDAKAIDELVDKRFIHELNNSKNGYINVSTESLKAEIIDTYSFGSNVYVKVLFKADSFEEDWVFSKNLNLKGPQWFLSNIERK